MFLQHGRHNTTKREWYQREGTTHQIIETYEVDALANRIHWCSLNSDIKESSCRTWDNQKHFAVELLVGYIQDSNVIENLLRREPPCQRCWHVARRGVEKSIDLTMIQAITSRLGAHVDRPTEFAVNIERAT